MEELLQTLSQNQAVATQRQVEESARHSASIERMMDMMAQLQVPRGDKQPVDPSAPLLPTPTTPPFHKQPVDPSAPLLPTPTIPPFKPPSPPPQHTIPYNQYPPHDTLATPYSQPSSRPDSYFQSTPRPPKLEIPIFAGDGVEGWLFQLKHYFEHHSIPPDQKLTVATFYLTGPALSWFHWMNLTHQIIGWDTFRNDLKSRFGPTSVYRPEVLINMLHQTSSVAHYIREFEALSTRTPGLSSDNLMFRFLAGLRPDVHHELLLLNPTTLKASMGLARIAKQKLISIRSYSNPRHTFTKPFTPSPGWTPRSSPPPKPSAHTEHHYPYANSPQPK
ncbi:unnamed protein product [Rhodiola kirilowii]